MNEHGDTDRMNALILDTICVATVDTISRHLVASQERDDAQLRASIDKLAKTAQKCGIVKGMCYGVIIANVINLITYLVRVYVWT